MSTITNPTNSTNLQTTLSGVPIAADTVVLNAGGQDITDNLAYLATIALAGFRTSPPRTGSLGTDGTVSIDATTVEIADGGRVHNISGVATKTFTDLAYAPASRGTLSLTDSRTTNLNMRAGSVEIASDADVTNAYGNGAERVHFKNGGIAMTMLEVVGAMASPNGVIPAYSAAAVLLDRDCNDLRIASGGRVIFGHPDVTPSGAVDLDGGRLDLVECGAINQINARAGLIDASQLKQSVAVGTWYVPGRVVIVKPWQSHFAFNLPAGSELKGGPITVLEASEALGRGMIALN